MEQICAICGRPLPENVTACPKCGTSVPTKPLGAQFVPEKPADTTPKHSGNCAICGRPLPEDADLCPNCGSSVHIELVAPQSEPEPPVVPTVTEEPPEAETPAKNPRPNPIACIANFWKKLSKKTKIITCITAGVLVLAIALIAIFASGSFTYQAAVNNYAALLNGDASKIAVLYPPEYIQYMAEKQHLTSDELIAQTKEALPPLLRSLESLYGKYTATCEILSEDVIDLQTLEKIKESLEKYGIDPSDVKAGKALDVQLTITGTKETYSDVNTYAALRIGSSWYLLTYLIRSDGSIMVNFLL